MTGKILKLAKLCGAVEYEYNKNVYEQGHEYTFTKTQLETFVNLIRADEKEQCAKIAETCIENKAAIAHAIRARGK